MMHPNTPAFPRPSHTDPAGDFVWPNEGMNLRTWMAGQVAAGTGYSGMQVGTDSQADRIVTLADAILERLQGPAAPKADNDQIAKLHAELQQEREAYKHLASHHNQECTCMEIY